MQFKNNLVTIVHEGRSTLNGMILVLCITKNTIYSSFIYDLLWLNKFDQGRGRVSGMKTYK